MNSWKLPVAPEPLRPKRRFALLLLVAEAEGKVVVAAEAPVGAAV